MRPQMNKNLLFKAQNKSKKVLRTIKTRKR